MIQKWTAKVRQRFDIIPILTKKSSIKNSNIGSLDYIILNINYLYFLDI